MILQIPAACAKSEQKAGRCSDDGNHFDMRRILGGVVEVFPHGLQSRKYTFLSDGADEGEGVSKLLRLLIYAQT